MGQKNNTNSSSEEFICFPNTGKWYCNRCKSEVVVVVTGKDAYIACTYCVTVCPLSNQN